jgi:aryl-alcohol dehydrogenase-like predicted oxidoreductase
VDRVDLIQLHHLVEPEDWERVFSEDGAVRACVEARDEGWVRFIGVTGHGTRVAAMHRASLERFDFDSVLLPYNFLQMRDPQYASDFEALLEICRERKVAVQTIKCIARSPWRNRRTSTAPCTGRSPGR